MSRSLDDTSWDAELDAETELALSRTGRDVGTPIITSRPPPGVSFFGGPVISRIPDDDEVLPLWEAAMTLAKSPCFAEMERSVRRGWPAAVPRSPRRVQGTTPLRWATCDGGRARIEVRVRSRVLPSRGAGQCLGVVDEGGLVMMMMTAEELAAACNADDEFLIAARRWNGAVRFRIDDGIVGLSLRDGVAGPWSKADLGVPTIDFSGPSSVWDQIFATRPPRLLNDLLPAEFTGQLIRSGDEMAYWQYFPAIARIIEIVRESAGALPNAGRSAPNLTAGRIDSPVGRYVHVDLDGVDHRIYFEEAGQGIPLLLQHTAGSHGVQYRHLFEMPEITDHFRLIAYDLPFHGKSVPPTSVAWWTQPYVLTRELAMAVPIALSAVLELERPAFMGCSVGGQLALDLACYHPDAFRAVIALEPALKLEGDLDALIGFWHPGVGSETKARMMHGLTSPDAPEALRRETVWAYSCGWPPSFIGDLHYYIDDHDLRELASTIDTTRCQVHMLSGEYDHSGTVELGRQAHEAIAGSTFEEMGGVGHFPMSEDPERLRDHLLPILKQIEAGG